MSVAGHLGANLPARTTSLDCVDPWHNSEAAGPVTYRPMSKRTVFDWLYDSCTTMQRLESLFSLTSPSGERFVKIMGEVGVDTESLATRVPPLKL